MSRTNLIERLRAKKVAINGRGVDPAERDTWGRYAYENPDGPEAAAEIERLRAAIADRNPEGGNEVPSRSDESGGSRSEIAQPSPRPPSRQTQ